MDHLPRAYRVNRFYRADKNLSVAVLTGSCAGTDGGYSGIELGFFDDDYRCRLEATVNVRAGFRCRAGLEFPVGGLLVVFAAGEDLSRQPVHVPLK